MFVYSGTYIPQSCFHLGFPLFLLFQFAGVWRKWWQASGRLDTNSLQIPTFVVRRAGATQHFSVNFCILIHQGYSNLLVENKNYTRRVATQTYSKHIPPCLIIYHFRVTQKREGRWTSTQPPWFLAWSVAKITAAKSTAAQLESNICVALSVQPPVAQDVGGKNDQGSTPMHGTVQRVEQFEPDSVPNDAQWSTYNII